MANMKKPKNPMTIMLLCLGILFGSIFLYKVAQSILFKRFMASNQSPMLVKRLPEKLRRLILLWILIRGMYLSKRLL